MFYRFLLILTLFISRILGVLGELSFWSIQFQYIFTLVENSTTTSNPFNFPWLENVPKLEFTTSKPNSMIEDLRNGILPRELVPFVNMTAVEELKRNSDNEVN